MESKDQMYFSSGARMAFRLPRLAMTFLVLLAAAARVEAQSESAVTPFAPGEVLTYRAISGRFGSFGSGTLRVDGPELVRGVAVSRLSFDFRGRIALMRIEDHTTSWVSTAGMHSLRYHKSERSPLGSRSEEIEIFPEEGRWQGLAGGSGTTTNGAPLDELSFLYYIRSLPLRDGDTYTLARHFDSVREPVLVAVLRREQTVVPAGEFSTVVVEMRVTDARVFGGSGVMRLYITDDATRIPVKIESSMPWVGSTRLVLESSQLPPTLSAR
jgi:hypothetical protein